MHARLSSFKSIVLATLLAVIVILSVSPLAASATSTEPQTVSFTFRKYAERVDPDSDLIKQFAFHLIGDNGYDQVHHDGDTAELSAGNYSLTETTVPGYMLDIWAGSCVESGQPDDVATTYFTIDPDEFGSLQGCQIYNIIDPDYTGGDGDGDGDGDPVTGMLNVSVVVVNDNGGTATSSDFSFQVNAASTTGFEADGTNSFAVATGTYSVTGVAKPGYTHSSDCAALLVVADGSVNCVITFNDIPAEVEDDGTLVVNTIVINNNGGASTPLDFSFKVNGGATTTTEADGSNALVVAPGSYTVVQNPNANYATTYEGCDAAVVVSGTTTVCTITNNDIPTGESLYKVEGRVWNDANSDDIFDEGEAPLAGWSVAITDGETSMSTTSDSSGYYSFMVYAGTWTISETVQAEWSQTFPNSGTHIVTVPTPVEMTEASLPFPLNLFFKVAHAQVAPVFGPFNFGNVFVGTPDTDDNDTSGGGNGKKISLGGGSNDDDEDEGEVLGDTDTVPTVAGAVAPAGAPNTGFGGAAGGTPLALAAPFVAMMLALLGVRRSN